jgi:hypothetical protein
MRLADKFVKKRIEVSVCLDDADGSHTVMQDAPANNFCLVLEKELTNESCDLARKT